MADTFTPAQRSRIMAKVKSRDTKPEMVVRRWLHAHGFRFRLHDKKMPGKPDVKLTKHRTVIFVHGCFWHRHPGCKRATTPASRVDYWTAKFQRNVERDARNRDTLAALGWNVVTLWECEIASGRFADILRRELNMEN